MGEIEGSILLKKDQILDGRKFLFGIAIGATILFIVWRIVAPYFIQSIDPLVLTTTESNLAKVIRELMKLNVDVAIVGTSVADRLKPQFFDQIKISNLAVEGGGSPMTGLEIIARKQIKPKAVYIEVNFLANGRNAEILRSVDGGFNWWIFSGLCKPFRYLLSGQKILQDHQGQAEKNQKLLESSTTEYYKEEELLKGVAWYHSKEEKDTRASSRENVVKINEIVSKLEADGMRVFYIFIPLAKAYEETEFFLEHKAAISDSADFWCPRCVDLESLVNIKELRWVDGIHLDDRSALVVSRAIERHFKSLGE